MACCKSSFSIQTTLNFLKKFIHHASSHGLLTRLKARIFFFGGRALALSIHNKQQTLSKPSQHKVTQQLLSHWQPFRDLKLMFSGSRHAEQLNLRSQQRIVATVEDSVLRTEMTGLESQEEDVPKRILFFKPMSCPGQIRSHRRDESWSVSL
jgi:hypothetical protein